MIAHLLSTIAYYEVQRTPLKLLPRPTATNYVRPPRDLYHYAPDHAATHE
ncbi:MAG: hypothetical protein ACYDDU_20130 [Dermatophilaceae bacterium]